MTEEIRQGDALVRLREMPAASVQCVVTSPPYYGLRDYGTDVWEGGDADCDHRRNKTPGPGSMTAGQAIVDERGKETYRAVCERCGARRVSPWIGGDPDCDHMHKTGGTASSTLGAASGGNDMSESARLRSTERSFVAYASTCGKCGAQRGGQWTGGDPGCDHSMAASRIVGNAPSLKSTLTTNNGAGPRPGDKFHADQRREVATECPCGARWTTSQLGLEQTPEEYVARLVDVFREVRRVLRDDGTVWLNLGDSYNNRSVARPSSHQGGLGFTNDSIERSWADQTQLGLTRMSLSTGGLKEKDLLGIPWMVAYALRDDGWYLRSDVIWAKPNPMPESVTDRPTSAHEHVFLLTKSARYFYDADAIREPHSEVSLARALRNRFGGKYQGSDPAEHGALKSGNGYGPDGDPDIVCSPGGRNKRNIWEIATQPYAEAHFATFPTKLVEPCILAGSSPKACGQCGAPWERVVETAYRVHENWFGDKQAARHSRGAAGASYREPVETRTTGWRSTCAHQDDAGRSLVLDPFAGSGTVGVVARWHGRNFAGIELNADYCALARRRILLEGHPGRRAEKIEPLPGQMAMDL